jgi:nucleoid-associated protein YgaU
VTVNKAGLANSLLGLGPGGGGLEKLTITHDGAEHATNGPIEALFNPGEIRRSRSVNWTRRAAANQGSGWTWADAQQQFLSVAPATLSVELFFDTYESRTPASTRAQLVSLVTPPNPFQTGDATDVTALTSRVIGLARVDKELHRPPLCRLSWGAFTDIFTGVLTQVQERFTMFLPDGTPVRATLSCSFVESMTVAEVRTREMHSADVVKTWVVRRTDTLHSIAATVYGDPRRWRHIATANGIVNPRALRPGTVLTIPKLS